MKDAWEMAVANMPTWVAIVILAFQFAAPIFHAWQNRPPQRLGGPISAAKAAWLVHATSLWLLLPLLMANLNPAYLWLAASMGLRTIIELPLCALRRWSTNYGLAHDAIHAAIALFWLSRVSPDVRLWLLLTLITLAAEIFFVIRFRKDTSGPANGVYFVPDDPAHIRLNLITDAVRMPSQFMLISVTVAACLRHLP
jgi:hypothetical protein